jgi:hypothetical protein
VILGPDCVTDSDEARRGVEQQLAGVEHEMVLRVGRSWQPAQGGVGPSYRVPYFSFVTSPCPRACLLDGCWAYWTDLGRRDLALTQAAAEKPCGA